jgi:hypothetical protein
MALGIDKQMMGHSLGLSKPVDQPRDHPGSKQVSAHFGGFGLYSAHMSI